MTALLKSRNAQLCMALFLGIVILTLPRPEGTKFKVSGDSERGFYQTISDRFNIVADGQKDADGYIVEAKTIEDSAPSGSKLLGN